MVEEGSHDIDGIFGLIENRLKKGLNHLDSEQLKKQLSMYAGTNSDRFSLGASGANRLTGRQRTLAKPGPHTIATLFRPTLDFISRARRISPRLIEIDDILSFLEDFYATFFVPVSHEELLVETGGKDGMKHMIRDIVGVEEATHLDEDNLAGFI